MPIRRGRFAPQNTFLETIAQKFDHGNSNFVLGSAQEKNNYPIVYCSDGFCELTGFTRSDLMRRSCACNFLYGLESNQDDIQSIEAALRTQKELKKEIMFYKKNGSAFHCLLDIVPIKNEKGNVVLFLVSHKDVTSRKVSNEVHNEEPANANGGAQQKLSRASRKFSRDVLLHLSRQYQQNNNATKATTARSFKRSRSFSFTSERLPQYKRETTKKSKFLFLHYSTKKGLWDWWILVLTFYIAIMVPYNVAFSRHGKARDLIIVDMVIELFFILDIVVHFRTTFVNTTGRIVYEQKAIAVHYLKGWFILDFLAALPFEALYFINQSWASAAFDRKGSAFKEGFLVQLLKCGRLLRLFRVVRKLHRYTEYSTVLLTLLMLAFAMVAHWLACVWYVIGLEEVSEKSTVSWLYQFGETIQMPYVNFSMNTGPDEGSAYVTSLYFTLTSMTTVGFGNVSANTNAEKAFAVIVMLIGALMHAAIFGNVAAIIQKLYANRVRYHSRANEIKQFIRVHHIDGDLANRLEDYFHTTWSLSGGVDTREILATFPHEIQSDVCMHLYKGLLELPLFSQAPRGLVRMLSLQVRPVYVGPGEYLLMQNDVVNCIYYIASGSMEVLQGESVAAILGKGDLFGEDISRKVPIRRSNGDVRALTYCDIYYITRDLLQDVLHLYSDFSFRFSERLELTYDLGASEKDIWRRGGLDSISEDEENEEDASDSPETGSDVTTSAFRNRFGIKSRIDKRPNHFTPNESWRFYPRPTKFGFDFNEKEPLLSTPEEGPSLTNRIRVLQPSNKQISLSNEHCSSNEQVNVPENATLEWENEPFTITKDEETNEEKDQHIIVDSINIDIESDINCQELSALDSGSPRSSPEKSYKCAKDSFLKQLRSNTDQSEHSNSIKFMRSENSSDCDSDDLHQGRDDNCFTEFVTSAQSPSLGMKRRSPNISPTHSLNSNRSTRMRKRGSSLQRLEFPSSEGLQDNQKSHRSNQDSLMYLSPSPATDSPYVSISRLFALTPPPKDDNDSCYGMHYASTPSSPARLRDAGSKTSLRRNATTEFISPASSCGRLSDDVRSTSSRRSRKKSIANPPPPSVFATLVAQAAKSPYADFVPPTIVRESTITCNCEEEESCSVCGDRDSSVRTMNDYLSSNVSEDGDERPTEKGTGIKISDSYENFHPEDSHLRTSITDKPDFSSQVSLNHLFDPLTPSTSTDLNVANENATRDFSVRSLKRKRQLTRETAVYSFSQGEDEDLHQQFHEIKDTPAKNPDYNIYQISWSSPSLDALSSNPRKESGTITNSNENCCEYDIIDIASTSIQKDMTSEDERKVIHSPTVSEQSIECQEKRHKKIDSLDHPHTTDHNLENSRNKINSSASSEVDKHLEVNCRDESELTSTEEFIADDYEKMNDNIASAFTEKQETGDIPPFFDEVIAGSSENVDPSAFPPTKDQSVHSSLSTLSSHHLSTFQSHASLTDHSVSNVDISSRDGHVIGQSKVSFHERKPTISGIHSTYSLNDVPHSRGNFATAHALCFSEPYLKLPRTTTQEKIDDIDSEFSDQQLEDIFKDVANAREAMERLQMILSSPEPSITSDLADTKETVKRLDKQVLHLNQDVTSLRSDVKMVLELLKGLKNGQVVNK